VKRRISLCCHAVLPCSYRPPLTFRIGLKPLLQLLIAGGVPKVGVNDVEAACCSQIADDAAIALE
jgi:hypothetical protein